VGEKIKREGGKGRKVMQVYTSPEIPHILADTSHSFLANSKLCLLGIKKERKK
jgi:hypothetical protein